MRHRAAKARASAGFTLLSVLVAMIVAGLGLLGMVRVALAVTAAATQNQLVAQLAPLSNAFWGIVQANPTPILTSSTLSGTTFTASNYTTAPSILQPWLLQATQALPNGAVTITTGPDAASGTACSVATGCSVTLTLAWTQVGAPGPNSASVTRSQVFYFQFGL